MSAKKSGGANSGAQMQQMLASAMMYAMSAAQVPPCSEGNGGACAMAAAFAAMGMLSGMQAGEHGDAAGSAELNGLSIRWFRNKSL